MRGVKFKFSYDGNIGFLNYLYLVQLFTGFVVMISITPIVTTAFFTALGTLAYFFPKPSADDQPTRSTAGPSGALRKGAAAPAPRAASWTSVLLHTLRYENQMWRESTKEQVNLDRLHARKAMSTLCSEHIFRSLVGDGGGDSAAGLRFAQLKAAISTAWLRDTRPAVMEEHRAKCDWAAEGGWDPPALPRRPLSDFEAEKLAELLMRTEHPHGDPHRSQLSAGGFMSLNSDSERPELHEIVAHITTKTSIRHRNAVSYSIGADSQLACGEIARA